MMVIRPEMAPLYTIAVCLHMQNMHEQIDSSALLQKNVKSLQRSNNIKSSL